LAGAGACLFAALNVHRYWHCCDGYGIPKQQGKPNSAKMQKTRINTGFLAAYGPIQALALQISFIAMLKLLFKFDRSY
jgi:hypothetical protein